MPELLVAHRKRLLPDVQCGVHIHLCIKEVHLNDARLRLNVRFIVKIPAGVDVVDKPTWWWTKAVVPAAQQGLELLAAGTPREPRVVLWIVNDVGVHGPRDPFVARVALNGRVAKIVDHGVLEHLWFVQGSGMLQKDMLPAAVGSNAQSLDNSCLASVMPLRCWTPLGISGAPCCPQC